MSDPTVGFALDLHLDDAGYRQRVDVRGLSTHVDGTLARSERGRLRIAGIRVRVEPVVPVADRPGSSSARERALLAARSRR